MWKHVVLIGLIGLLSAQITKEERRTLRREMNREAIKQAKKESKRFRKMGYDVPPGSLPMEKSLEYTWMKLLQRDEEGKAMYLSADGNAVGETRTAAEMQALEVAKLNLAGQLETIIRSIVEANIANAQLNNQEAASVTKVVQGAKNIIATKLGPVEPAFKIFRNLPNKNVEVNLKLLHNRRDALEVAKKAIREELEKDLQNIQHKLDKLLPIQ
ncbi:MAG: hypothetical protein ACUVRD_02185 [Bacteroidia bacterium]